MKEKRRLFMKHRVDINLLLTITNCRRALRGVNFDDLELPWTSKTKFFLDFWVFLAIFAAAHCAHLESKLRRNGWR